MWLEDIERGGPAYQPVPVSGLREEKRRRAQQTTRGGQFVSSVSSLPVEQESFLHSLSTLVDPLSPAASLPAPPLQPNTRAVSFIDGHIAHYQQHVKASASTTSTSTSTAQSQLNTLILLHHLRSAEDSIAATLTDRTAPSQPLDSAYSDRNKVLNIIGSSATLLRSLAVIDWLEELSDGDVLVERTGSVGWKRTLRRVQRSGGSGSSEEQLGLDVESVAGRRVLDESDREDEALLLRYVWQYMRAGRMQDAIALCAAFKQPWRAASISGGQLWHIDSPTLNGATAASGNKQHFLFKQSCKLLSSAPLSSAYERAVYGLLGSEVAAVLPVCRTWEDCVWGMHRVMVDREIDALLGRQTKDSSERRYAQQLTAATNAAAGGPAAVFERIARGDDAVPSAARQAAASLYHRLQMALVLGEYERAEQLLVEAVERDADDELLVFAVHVYLYLHPTASTSTMTDNGTRLLTAYLAYLRRQRLYPLVPVYAAYLPAEAQVAEYAAFLRELGTLAERQDYLALANYYFAHNTLAITSQFVQSVIDEQPAQLRLTGAADAAEGGRLRVSVDSGAVSASDMFRIECLDCFSIVLTGSGGSRPDRLCVLEAMRLSCLLFRSFMRADRLSAAKALSDALLRKKFDQFIAMDDEDEAAGDGEADAARSELLQTHRPRVEHEYVGWMRYVGAMRWYAAWASKLAVRPTAPPPLSSVAGVSQADQRRHEREVNRYRETESEWRRGWDEITTACIDAVLSCLQQDGVGWMKRGGGELETWRRELIPRLLFLLLHVCEVGERGEEGLRVVDVVADERFRLYEAMEVAERRAILRKCKDGYVRWVLRAKEERRRLKRAAEALRGEDEMEAGEKKHQDEAAAEEEAQAKAVEEETKQAAPHAVADVQDNASLSVRNAAPRSSSVPPQRAQPRQPSQPRAASKAREVLVLRFAAERIQQHHRQHSLRDQPQPQHDDERQQQQQRQEQQEQREDERQEEQQAEQVDDSDEQTQPQSEPEQQPAAQQEEQVEVEEDEQMAVDEQPVEQQVELDTEEPSNEPVVGPAALTFVPPLQPPAEEDEEQRRDEEMSIEEPPAKGADGVSDEAEPAPLVVVHSVLHSPHSNPYQAQPVEVLSLEPASLPSTAESTLEDAPVEPQRPRRSTRSSSRLRSAERELQPPGSPTLSVAESEQSELSSVPEEGAVKLRRSTRRREPKKPVEPTTRVLRSRKS